jgi:hypothetical protein
MTRGKPYSTAELVDLIERGDSVGLWQLANAGGIQNKPRDEVRDFVIRSVEPGLRSGAIVAGRLYHLTGTEPFDPIDEPVDQVLDSIRDALAQEEPDWIEVDINFDVPER